MQNVKRVKVAVTGPAGQIGYALLFRLASGAVFGPEVEIDLHLVEIEAALPALRGVVMELEDCAFPLLRNIIVTHDLNEGFKDVNWAILVGSAPRKEGMERADLLQINGGIFKKQGQTLNDNANSDLRVFVVGNPCNTNALIAMNHAPDVPKNRFYAMTMLDQNRATSQLAQKAGVDVADVTNMIIWGNHSATQFPDFYNAQISGKPVIETIHDQQWLETEFIPMVQKRGGEVIKARGASSAASAANAIIGGLNSLITNSAKDQVYSMCCHSNGEYGVDAGLIYSFPCRTVNGDAIIVPGITHADYSLQKLQLTLDELRSERDAVTALKLI